MKITTRAIGEWWNRPSGIMINSCCCIYLSFLFVFKTLEITKLKTVTTGIGVCFENDLRVIGDTFKVLLLNMYSIFYLILISFIFILNRNIQGQQTVFFFYGTQILVPPSSFQAIYHCTCLGIWLWKSQSDPIWTS
jgi:hypothetical protein